MQDTERNITRIEDGPKKELKKPIFLDIGGTPADFDDVFNAMMDGYQGDVINPNLDPKADGRHLNYADGSVAVVRMGNVIGDPTIEDYWSLLTEAARVLSKGGILKIVEIFTPEVARERLFDKDNNFRFENLGLRKKNFSTKSLEAEKQYFILNRPKDYFILELEKV